MEESMYVTSCGWSYERISVYLQLGIFFVISEGLKIGG